MKIIIRELVISADIAVNPEEIGLRQVLVMDIILRVDRIAADEIDATIDYREVVRTAERFGERRIALIETFAISLAEALLCDPHVNRATVTVAKPSALESGIASAQISRRRMTKLAGSSLRGETNRLDAAQRASAAASPC